MSETLHDAEIVRGLRQGDRRAWEALCEQFSPRVWRYVARLVGQDEHAVADVFQETMLAVAKAGRTLAEESKLWPWLAAIGHNQAALYWRKTYADRNIVFRSASAASAEDHNPLENLMQAETVEFVRSLLAEMNSDAVSLLLGKYLDGHSIAELVELMGGTYESLRSRLARARRDFRARYERATQFPGQPENTVLKELSPREGDLP